MRVLEDNKGGKPMRSPYMNVYLDISCAVCGGVIYTGDLIHHAADPTHPGDELVLHAECLRHVKSS